MTGKREIGFGERRGIDPGKSLGMPGGFGLCERQRLAQSALPLASDLVLGP
jgi:hypothetical protein